MTTGIYGIFCTANDKWYVGQSQDIEERFRDHATRLNKGNHHNSHLQKAYQKYGGTHFQFSVLEECPIDKLDDREIFWISKLNAFQGGFNFSEGGGGVRGFTFTLSEESRKKLSEATKGRPSPRKGKPAWNRGLKITFSEEHRQKISVSLKGKPLSAETRMKLSEANKGRKHSEETKQKISQATQGRVPWNKGKKKSETDD